MTAGVQLNGELKDGCNVIYSTYDRSTVMAVIHGGITCHFYLYMHQNANIIIDGLFVCSA